MSIDFVVCPGDITVPVTCYNDFVGIGINYYPYKDTIAVIKPTEGGPSERAGIMGGDRILLADGDTIYGRSITNDLITKKLKGDKNI